MQSKIQKKEGFLTKKFCLMMLVSQSIGISAGTSVPGIALRSGAFGFMIWYTLICVLLGIPLIYMELIIGQFTGLNTIEIWKVRPIVSHFGHILIFWQSLNLLVSHVLATFVIHYMLISFKNPKPYYTCGPGANNCDIIAKNFTINNDCIRSGFKYAYCDKIFHTFPEIQYYRLVTASNHGLHVEWQLCLPSAIACLLLYLSCFKRGRSMEWFLCLLTFYPGFGFILLMLGSLLQKGIIMFFQEAIDINFSIFSEHFKVTDVFEMVTNTIAVGRGLIINEGASCRFRAPCYANAVLAITANIAFHLLIVCSYAMMSCPFTYERNVSTQRTVNVSLSFLFERVPTMLHEYDNNSFWTIITYSSYACIAVRTTIIIYYNLLEVFIKKYSIIEKYSGLVTFGASVILFIVTIPFLGNVMKLFVTKSFRRCNQLISMLVVVTECFVFVLFYGLDRFCEDVHFMQGFRPSNYMKFAWIVSSVLLLYVCFDLLYLIVTTTKKLESAIGIYILGIAMVYMMGLMIVKLSVSGCKKKLAASLQLGMAWHPRNEPLQRSRAMFTAQAMTKEYLYRQYHLQAGIQARQQRANPKRDNTTL